MNVRPSASGFGDPVTQADEAHRAGRAPRDWAVDTLCFLLCIGFTALAFVDGTDWHLPPVQTAVEAALGGLASLGLWLRRRWPVGFAVIVGLFGIYSVSASGVALIALFTVAVHRRLGMAVLVAAGYALTSFLTVRRVAAELAAGRARRRLCRGGARVGMFVRARRQLALTERERAASEQEFRLAQARQMGTQPDRAGDARRARPSPVVAEHASRSAGAVARHVARGDISRRRRDPQQCRTGAGSPPQAAAQPAQTVG